MTELKVRPRKLSSAEKIQQEIAEYRKAAKLDSWNSFVEDLSIPSDIYPAVITNRPELMRAVKPRDMKAAEVEVLYKLIAGLLDTNAALRMHTQRVAQLTDNLNGSMTAFVRAAQSIHDFANFKVRFVSDEEEEEGA